MNKAALTGARLRLERAKYESDRAEIRAPVSGGIAEITVTVGDQVASGASLLIVVDTRHVRVNT